MTKKEFVESVRKDVFLLTSEGYISEAEGAEMFEKAVGKDADLDADDDEKKRKAKAKAAKDADLDADDDEKKAMKKGLFKSAIFPKSVGYDIDAIPQSGPSVADEGGTDALSREYSDDVMARIAGAMARLLGGDPDAIPNAGAGPTVETTTQGIAYDAQQFMGEGEGDKGRIGGEDGHGMGSGNPPRGYDVKERVTAITRVGPNWLLGGSNGIAAASSARFPSALTSVLKSKGVKGLFSNIIKRPTSEENGRG